MLPFRSIRTAEGVISSRNPFLTMWARPFSTRAISELVVPRSIPKSIVFLAICPAIRLSDDHLRHLVQFSIKENRRTHCFLHDSVGRLFSRGVIKGQNVQAHAFIVGLTGIIPGFDAYLPQDMPNLVDRKGDRGIFAPGGRL